MTIPDETARYCPKCGNRLKRCPLFTSIDWVCPHCETDAAVLTDQTIDEMIEALEKEIFDGE